MSPTATSSAKTSGAPRAVLFDRDGTLVVDVAYNADPGRVRAMPTVATTLRMLRSAGIPVGVLTNQSGVGRGLLTEEDVRLVNARIEELLGPFDLWQICPHRADEECACRKPKPGMILEAAAKLGLPPSAVAYIGDIGSDIEAATAAGAQSVLVPTPVTKPQEVRQAPLVAADVAGAVSLLFSGREPQS